MCYTGGVKTDTAKTPKRQPTPLRLNDEERGMAQRWADEWGVSLAAAIRRIIREYGQGAKGGKR